MKILVTGTEGYIGAILAPMLMAAGHDVVGLDTGFYRDGWLYSNRKNTPMQPKMLNRDLRTLTIEDMQGYDVVIHLAELSNDPLGQNNPEVTYKINHQGSVKLAQLCKQAGIERFVYTSSCSVYGAGTGDFLDETSAVNPQTAYAECKVMVERDVSLLADDSFSPVFLRNATAYGASPRMRFDIVLNDLSGIAWTEKKIAMISDGTPWRPLVHVQDICTAIICSVEAPRAAIHNQIFNVGKSDNNYRVREIAEIVGSVFPGCEVSFGAGGADNRSYRVNFDKISTQLPGFVCRWDATAGARQLREVFEQIQMTTEVYKAKPFTRIKQLRYLIETAQIDADFFWNF